MLIGVKPGHFQVDPQQLGRYTVFVNIHALRVYYLDMGSKKRLVISTGAIGLLIAIGVYGFISKSHSSRSNPTQGAQQNQAGTADASVSNPVDTQANTPTNSTPDNTAPSHPIDQPDSIWMIVNKHQPLPATYAPPDLTTVGAKQMRAEAADAIKRLVTAAKQDGVALTYVSGYRAYSTQQSLYDSYVANDGQAKADTYSARPGHSEHQTGLAMDVGNANGDCELDVCFADTAGGEWIAAHAHEYGFIIRYLSGKTAITGYQYEPWHVRYVGTWLADTLHASGQTMEEYFNTAAAPNYQ